MSALVGRAPLTDDVPIDANVFQDEENDEDGPKRQISDNAAFAQQHAAAFDSASCFESRKLGLRQIMKSVVAAEHSKNPKLAIQDIHQQKGQAVLGIVQVR